MAYVHANILLHATYMTPKEDLVERARTFEVPLVVLSQYMRRCWVAREPVELLRHCHTNNFRALSILCLHQAVEMATAMVPATAIPRPGGRGGYRGGRSRGRPHTPRGAPSQPAKKGPCCKRQ